MFWAAMAAPPRLEQSLRTTKVVVTAILSREDEHSTPIPSFVKNPHGLRTVTSMVSTYQVYRTKKLRLDSNNPSYGSLGRTRWER